MAPRFRSDSSRQSTIGAARLPTETDTDWILAALHHDATGVSAWKRISDRTDPNRLPDAHGRLAPLVYETLSQAGIKDPIVRQLVGTRLTRLTALKRLNDAVSPILEELTAENIDVMVLKGAALSDLYSSPAHRPMADLDLLVRPRDLPTVQEILNRHRLRCVRDICEPVQIACLHSATFEPTENAFGSIDLHWMASPQLAPSGIAAAQWRRPWFSQLADDEFWDRARPVKFLECEVRAPSMTDLLLLVVLHGVRFGTADDTRWAVDATTILRNRSNEIDWQLFVQEATRRKVSAVTATALSFLRDNVYVGSLDGLLPEFVIARLQEAKPSTRERTIDRLSRHEYSMKPGAPRIVLDVVVRHLVLTANESPCATFRSFPWFVALWLGVERPRQIPGFLRRGTWRERLPT